MANRIVPLETKFWRHVVVTSQEECWPWLGVKMKNGYGQLQHLAKTILAHRASYILHFGEIPSGAVIMHKCDNPCCVNPSHLCVGSQKENIHDMDTKGRRIIARKKPNFRGEKNHQTKLTESQVLDILASNETMLSLSKKYGVAFSCIWSIKNKKTWKYLHDS